MQGPLILVFLISTQFGLLHALGMLQHPKIFYIGFLGRGGTVVTFYHTVISIG